MNQFSPCALPLSNRKFSGDNALYQSTIYNMFYDTGGQKRI